MSDSQVLQGSRLVSARTVAQALGVHLSTVYRAAADGSLPSLRIRGRFKFDPDEVAASVLAAREAGAQ